MKGDPDHYRTQSLLAVLVEGQETSCFEDRTPNAAFFQQSDDQGSNRIPDQVKRRVEDPVRGLNREVRPSVPGDRMWEGIGLEVGAIHQLGRVGSDSVPVMFTLILRDKGIRSEAELGEGRRIAQSRRGQGVDLFLLD